MLTGFLLPGPPVFERASLKNWEWPGDEASGIIFGMINELYL